MSGLTASCCKKAGEKIAYLFSSVFNFSTSSRQADKESNAPGHRKEGRGENGDGFEEEEQKEGRVSGGEG